MKKEYPKIFCKVTLNHSGENHVFWKYGVTEKQCVNFSRLSLEEKLGLRKGALTSVFNGRRNNFEVEKREE